MVLGELATGDATARLRVQPLSAEAVAHLAEPHDGVDVEELYRNTAGNPFFVSEVLAAGPGEVPQTVRDAVLALAKHHAFARKLVNSGRLSLPFIYRESRLNMPDREGEMFSGVMVPGAPAADALESAGAVGSSIICMGIALLAFRADLETGRGSARA